MTNYLCQIEGDEQVENWERRAEDRLAELELSSALLIDESGQTSESEHLRWLATAPADDITRWANDMARDAE
jgi:hypothetical protein